MDGCTCIEEVRKDDVGPQAAHFMTPFDQPSIAMNHRHAAA